MLAGVGRRRWWRKKLESFLESAQQLRSYAEERQKGKELQSKRIEPMETGHNPRITPGTHSLLGGQECRVFRKMPHRLFYSAKQIVFLWNIF